MEGVQQGPVLVGTFFTTSKLIPMAMELWRPPQKLYKCDRRTWPATNHCPADLQHLRMHAAHDKDKEKGCAVTPRPHIVRDGVPHEIVKLFQVVLDFVEAVQRSNMERYLDERFGDDANLMTSTSNRMST